MTFTGSSDEASAPMGDWRELAEWDWVIRLDEGDHFLHAVAELDNEDTADDDWHGEGKTVCGVTDSLWIPGLFSRMGSERCPACCDATGMPHGKQSPKNVDACRPLVEKRLAALNA